jgi:hypothetical protein
MHVVRDLLDTAVVDRNGHPMGRADRVVVECREHAPPRVIAIEIGAGALAARVSRRCGDWIARLLDAAGFGGGQRMRIGVRQFLRITDRITVDVSFGDTAAATVERKLRSVVRPIPGARA